MAKNPHNYPIALDPPRKDPSRRWRCKYCGATGLYDDLCDIECTYVYPPCEVCGQTPECAPDCAGVLAALGAPGVRVIGDKKPENPDA